MKQLFTVAGIAAILLSLSACGGTDRRDGTDHPPALILPVTLENRPAIERAIRFREELRARLQAEGYEEAQIEEMIRLAEKQARQEALRRRQEQADQGRSQTIGLYRNGSANR